MLSRVIKGLISLSQGVATTFCIQVTLVKNTVVETFIPILEGLHQGLVGQEGGTAWGGRCRGVETILKRGGQGNHGKLLGKMGQGLRLAYCCITGSTINPTDSASKFVKSIFNISQQFTTSPLLMQQRMDR
jgi:hypothetical protein